MAISRPQWEASQQQEAQERGPDQEHAPENDHREHGHEADQPLQHGVSAPATPRRAASSIAVRRGVNGTTATPNAK
jgi:hypothetical protein